MKKMKSYVKDNSKDIIQFIKFNLVGVANTLVDIGVFALLNKVFGVYYLIANVISYSCGVINSYIMNTNWTFKGNTKNDLKEGIKFIIVNIVSLGASSLFIYIFKENMHIGPFISKILATGISVVVNFLGNKLWVFKS